MDTFSDNMNEHYYNKYQKDGVVTIHSYYFTESHNYLIGVLPNTSIVIKFEKPFSSFDKKTRILSLGDIKVHLPEKNVETSKNPSLRENTTMYLNKI